MSIGDRIVFNGKRGTIAFIGEIPPFIGEWYGIDWDSPNDGKHDGTYKGIRYFQTTYAQSGSFVKSTEVNFGNKFVDALKDQYDFDVIKAREDYENSMKDFPVSIFDFANLEKVKRLQGPLNTLQIVNLSAYNVSNVGEPGEIEHACPNIVDLDLSNNLMTSWRPITEIARQLKNLKSLTLNDCRLSVPDNPKEYENFFKNLQHIFLCRTLYKWEDILKIAVMLPRIETLKVPFCRIVSLETPIGILQNVKNVDIQGNKIFKWSEINKLGQLPKLEILNACNTGIAEIILPAEERLFLKLHTLYVSENFIKNYVDIIDLTNFPLLRDLRINKNPITSDDKNLSYREKIIARIGSLKVLNGHEIQPDERRSSEYGYLQEFAKDWFQCVNDEKKQAKFLFEHPRYLHLVQKYGPAEVPTEIDPSLKGHLITINLIHVNENGTQKIIKKRVHLSLAVYKLITIAKRAFNLKTEYPKLVRVSSKNPAIKIEMGDQLKSMNTYAVEDGDTIYINY